jgi:hypothetical protein
MQNLDNLNKLLAFTSVNNILEHEIVPVSDDAKIRIQHIETFFEQTIIGLKSISEEKYVPVENLMKILEFAGHFTKGKMIIQQWQEIENAIDEFKIYLKTLKDLEENPKRLYSEEPRRVSQLLKICKKMYGLYERLDYEENLYEDIRTLNKDD